MMSSIKEELSSNHKNNNGDDDDDDAEEDEEDEDDDFDGDHQLKTTESSAISDEAEMNVKKPILNQRIAFAHPDFQPLQPSPMVPKHFQTANVPIGLNPITLSSYQSNPPLSSSIHNPRSRPSDHHRTLAQQALINRALRNRRHTLANVNRLKCNKFCELHLIRFWSNSIFIPLIPFRTMKGFFKLTVPTLWDDSCSNFSQVILACSLLIFTF
ncbi:hypothetical protein SSS_08950 [Sarcoptes scabiei]|uniref:Uncharacterized protein n=1 Tax=Sarcoptes scabiei TaxID=52283 RepID=A0A834RDV7_SARSC|nr:hypothetical protein SSS_08950 [Sarcoptes scabiei]